VATKAGGAVEHGLLRGPSVSILMNEQFSIARGRQSRLHLDLERSVIAPACRRIAGIDGPSSLIGRGPLAPRRHPQRRMAVRRRQRGRLTTSTLWAGATERGEMPRSRGLASKAITRARRKRAISAALNMPI